MTYTPLGQSDYKASVRAASAGSDVDTSSPGASIDGVTLASGDRILLKDQSIGSQNGIWIWSGPTSSLIRARDADQDNELTPGSQVSVEEGNSNKNTIWAVTTDGTIVIGVTNITFEKVIGGTGILGSTPVGVVNPFAGATAPTGWLLCYGQEIDRTIYSELFSVIGTTYGNGDGSNTFNVPDLRGRSISGVDNMGGSDAGRLDWTNSRGISGGAQYVTLSEAEMPAHSHTVDSHSHGGSTEGSTADISSASTNSTGSHSHTVDSHSHGGSTGTANATVSATTNSTGGHFHEPNVDPYFRTAPDGSAYQLKTSQIVSGTGSGYYAESTTYTNGQTSTNGAHSHTVTISQTAHSHTVTAEAPGTDSQGTHSHTVSITQTDHTHAINAEAPGTDTKGSGSAHENMPPTILLNYIIFSGV